jgi:uncharacterized protein with beta-barrel porin domain
LFKTGDNKEITNKFRINGLTLGMDYSAGDRSILGVAAGLGKGDNNAQDPGASVNSIQKSLTGYGLWGFGANWIADAMLGYSSHAFIGERTTSDGAATLGMSRTGSSIFSSTSLSKVWRFSDYKIAPFARQDYTLLRLDQYNETGDSNYALGYGNTNYAFGTSSVGLMITNEIELDRGKLVTSAKISENRMRTGSISQDVFYADTGLAGGVYTLQQNSSFQDSQSLTLGMRYSNRAGDVFDIGWTGAVGANQYKLSGLRIGVTIAM